MRGSRAQRKAIDIRINDVRNRHVGRCLHEEHFFISQDQEVSYAQDKHRHNGWHDGRNRDVNDLLEAARAVDTGSLEQFSAYSGNGGKVDDCRPSGKLPHVCENIEQAEVYGFVEIIDSGYAEYGAQQPVEQTRRGRQKLAEYGDNDDRRDKAGHIADGLDEAPYMHASHLIKQYGKDNRDRKVDCQIFDADDKCVAKGCPKLFLSQKLFEIPQRRFGPADTVRTGQRLETAKSKDVPQHGAIFKNQQEAKGHQHHGIKLPIAPHVLTERRTVSL